MISAVTRELRPGQFVIRSGWTARPILIVAIDRVTTWDEGELYNVVFVGRNGLQHLPFSGDTMWRIHE